MGDFQTIVLHRINNESGSKYMLDRLDAEFKKIDDAARQTYEAELIDL